MTKWQLRSKRKSTGGLLKRNSKKKKYQRARDYVPTLIGNTKRKKIRVRGGNKKYILLSTDEVNVYTGEKTERTKIKSVIENKANPQYIRRNIITKGAIIETELGKARVTSRPGQDGILNAVLIKENK